MAVLDAGAERLEPNGGEGSSVNGLKTFKLALPTRLLYVFVLPSDGCCVWNVITTLGVPLGVEGVANPSFALF